MLPFLSDTPVPEREGERERLGCCECERAGGAYIDGERMGEDETEPLGRRKGRKLSNDGARVGPSFEWSSR